MIQKRPGQIGAGEFGCEPILFSALIYNGNWPQIDDLLGACRIIAPSDEIERDSAGRRRPRSDRRNI
jgi:hypothetical protein